ncbi:MAG TPA: hypothetical protein VFS20_06280 [Longimicrobium sp.]|nr:hypothetical protein [Longimicrobium sp.]
MSMDILIREAGGIRRAGALVIGRGVPLATTAGGLPELESVVVGETQLRPSGGDDTQAIRDALTRASRVRLGPGVFTLSDTLVLGAGQELAGCGPSRTTLRMPVKNGDALVSLSGANVLEGMTLAGPGWSTQFVAGVKSGAGTGLRLRQLRIEEVERGISLTGVERVEISGITTGRISTVGIMVISGKQVAIENADVGSDVALTRGLLLSEVETLRCESVVVRYCEQGIVADGSALAFRAVRVADCDMAISVRGSGVEVSGALVADSNTGFRLLECTGAALDGCVSLRGMGSTLTLSNCRGVAVSGLRSDMTGAAAGAPPHVAVSGSTQVMITAVHRINPATPPQYEVDVSAAGGRVLFIQHDFDSDRIRSGGNFAQF